MPIIFGIKRKAYRLATVFAVCGLCHTPAAQAVARVRTFFSLFFIPVVPLTSQYRTTCTMCGQSVKITNEHADQLVASVQGATPQPPLAAPAFGSAPADPPAGLPQPTDRTLPPV
jgi:hypothetical protein